MKKTAFLLSSFIIIASFGGLNAQKPRLELQGLSLHETQIALAIQDPELCGFISSQCRQTKPKLPIKTQSAKNTFDAFAKKRKTPDQLLKALKNKPLLVKFLKKPEPFLRWPQTTKRNWRV